MRQFLSTLIAWQWLYPKGINVAAFIKKHMLTPTIFNKLTTLQQANVIWQYGVSVSDLSDKIYAYALYQLYDFYVEVKFSKTDFLLKQICAFSSNCSHLDLYIKEIDLSQVLYAS